MKQFETDHSDKKPLFKTLLNKYNVEMATANLRNT